MHLGRTLHSGTSSRAADMQTCKQVMHAEHTRHRLHWHTHMLSVTDNLQATAPHLKVEEEEEEEEGVLHGAHAATLQRTAG